MRTLAEGSSSALTSAARAAAARGPWAVSPTAAQYAHAAVRVAQHHNLLLKCIRPAHEIGGSQHPFQRI